tara:strand:+ start:29360 stop:29776 length:417 start_codon:yes stop_codon:yes gene_type:complete
MIFESNSVEETIDFARKFAERLHPGSVVCLVGELGAGKTHFMKGIASYFGVKASAVSSPTFTLINEYKGTTPIFHFDCYRLEGEQEAVEIGVEEYLYGEGISIVEWPNKMSGLLPEESIFIEIKHAGDSQRIIHILEE